MKKILSLLSLLITLSSCAAVELPTGDDLFNVQGMQREDDATQDDALTTSLTDVSPVNKDNRVPYTVLYEAPGLERAQYEPPFGCYLGALLTSGSALREFNRSVKHAVYTVDITLGGDFPATWMLSCIAAQATPLVLLHPNPETGLSITEINEAAVWLGSYNLPMFVAFCPLTAETEISKDHYRVYYRHARSLLKIQTPQASAVWLVDAEAENASDFYPGDDVVDWVGFMSRDDYEPGHDVLSAFEDFYMAYQETKPVMLGPFGISHFSAKDYTYRIEETAGKIAELYTAIRDTYPRVKMMVYANVNLIPDGGGNDYSFSQSEELTAAYTNATGGGYYLTALGKWNASERSEWLRSSEVGYFEDGQASVAGAVQPDHAKRVLYVWRDAAVLP